MKRAFPLLFALSVFWAVPGEAFSDLPESERISADELRSEQMAKKDLVLLDARDRKSYEDGHVAGAKLPLSENFYRQQGLYDTQITSTAPDRNAALAEAMKDTPKEAAIVTYCNTDCRASVHLLLSLKSLGFSNVKAMEEGFQAWEAKGYPVERKEI